MALAVTAVTTAAAAAAFHSPSLIQTIQSIPLVTAIGETEGENFRNEREGTDRKSENVLSGGEGRGWDGLIDWPWYCECSSRKTKCLHLIGGAEGVGGAYLDHQALDPFHSLSVCLAPSSSGVN
jgi:hypothetical protein